MPSPVGHAIVGFATAWFADAVAPSPRGERVGVRSRRVLGALGDGFALACALVAAFPDLDVLMASHRTYSHTLGAAVIAGIVAAMVAARMRLPVARTGIVCEAAYATHVLLDWLGKDTASPYGIMAVWPLSSAFYTSGADLFLEISRRYWKPDEFIVGNLQSMAWEILLLAPIAAVAWWARRKSRSAVHEVHQEHEVTLNARPPT